MADDFDFDFDDGMDDLLGGMNENENTEKPKNKREVVTQSLKDGAKGFIETYTDTPLETINKMAEKAIPNEISSEVDTVKELGNSIKDEYLNTANEVKKNAKATLSVVKRVLPKNELVEKITNKLDNFLGKDEEQEKKQSEEEILNSNIANSINETLGNDSIANVDNLFKETLEFNRNKTNIELLNSISARLNENNHFNKQITHAYYKKSLELQYKSIYIAKEQLTTLNSIGKNFANQFESIIKNTSLPDIVKVRSSEAIKANLRQKITGDITDKLFKDKNLLGSAKDRIKDIGTNIRTKLMDGLEAVTGIAEQKEAMGDMDIPGMSKSNMVGSMASDELNSYVGTLLSRKLAGNKNVKEAMYKFKNFMADPSAYLNEAADNIGNDSVLKSKANLGVRFVSDILKTNSVADNISIGKDDMNEAKLFDNRAYTSLTKVIPGLLSKIYGEIKSIRTNTKPEDNELTFDNDKDIFISKKDSVKNFKEKITTNFKYNSKVELSTIADRFSEYGGFPIRKNKDKEVLEKAILNYIMDGKPLVPALMEKNGFLDYFPQNYKKLAKTTLKNLSKHLKEEPYDNEMMIKNLKSFKNSLPKIDKEVENMVDSGNVRDLIDSGILTYDEQYKKYNVDSSKIQDLFSKSIKDLNKPLKESFAKGGYTGDGSKYEKAGTVHKEEYVLNKEKLKDIIDSVKKDDIEKIRSVFKDVVNDVTTKSKSTFSNAKTMYETKLKDNVSKLKDVKNSDKLNDIKDSVSSKIDDINIRNIKLSPEQETELMDTFLNSRAYLEGKVRTFNEFKESLGIKIDSDSVNNIIADSKQKAMSTFKEVKEFIKDKLNPFLKEATPEELEYLREQFFNSRAYAEGKVTNFNTYLKSLGYKPKFNIKLNIQKFLKKTRELDRKIFKAGLKAPGKLLSLGTKGIKLGAKGAYETAKVGLKGVGIVAGSVGKQLTGYDARHPDEFTELGETRKLDKAAMKAMINLPSTIAQSIKNIVTKKKKVNPFDKDGDGDRDGNWKDRLKGLFSKSDTKDKRKKGIINTIKNNKGMSTAMILTGLLFAAKSMGVTMEDVKGFVSGVVKGVKNVGSVLGSIWDVLKSTYNTIKDLGSTIVDGIGGFLKKILPNWMTKGKKKWYNPLSWGNESEESDTDNTSNTGMNVGEGVVYGAAGLAAYKTGKVGYKVAKAGMSVVKGTAKTVKGAVNVAKKAGGIAKKVKPKPKVKPGKLKAFLSKLKNIIVKKIGPKAGAKLLGKIASRFVPVLGWSLLVYDAANIGYDMIKNGTDFKTAVSKQILGFNIFDSDDVPVDEDGNPIKPDMPIANNIDSIKSNKPKEFESSKDLFSKTKELVQANNTNYKINKSINIKQSVVGDGEDKPAKNAPANNSNYKASSIVIRGGEEYSPDNGDNNITLSSGVDIDGLNPAMHNKLKSMANEYNAITGKKININSGYRSTADQIKLRKKYGSKAARPGHSTHEFGLATDINSSTLDELDKLGLLGKYKFTRPVGKEKWHMEPSGIQLNIDDAKKDVNLAANLIESASKGGSGWGTVNGARKYSRNKEFQKDILTTKSVKIIDPNTGKVDPEKPLTSNDKLVAKTNDQTINKTTNKTSSIIDTEKAVINKKRNDNLVKPMNANVELAKASSQALGNIDNTLKQSLTIQSRMLDKLDILVKQNVVLNDKKEKEIEVPIANNTTRNSVMPERTTLPNPAIDLSRHG